jgi:hypothetical protein
MGFCENLSISGRVRLELRIEIHNPASRAFRRHLEIDRSSN